MRTLGQPPAPASSPWRPIRGAVATAIIAALSAGLLLAPGATRPVLADLETGAHATVRAVRQQQGLEAVRGWPHYPSPHFVTYYGPGLVAAAAIVAQAAEAYYPTIAADFGLSDAGPRRTLVVLSPQDMARDVDGGAAAPPLGAYYDGIIWLLNPSAFLDPGAGLALRFSSSGPVAHELTHLAADIRSGGRIPAWFDEGLAQYEDWRLTGYVWVQGDSGFGAQVYSWKQLTTDFLSLPNQALAYRQALAATATVCRVRPGACVEVLDALRQGRPLVAAVRDVLGEPGLAALQAGAAWQAGLEPRPGATAGPRP